MWCKLDDIAYVGTGATPLTACKYYYENGNIAWINSSSTKVPFIAKASNFITQKAIEETNCLVYPKGTLVIAMYGEGKTRGQISELLIDAATNQACAAVRPYSEATKKYLKLFFEGNYLHIRALAEGGNQQNLSVGKIQNYEIPLPPLDEQKRILDKAKELLLQIDNIEVGKNVCQKYINQAKSKVLDLAIHGKLVSQDPNDEPAIELLKRINPKAEIITDNGHYQKLPEGWCLTILGSIGTWQSGATPSRLQKDYYGGNIPWLKTGDLNDGIITNIPEFITEKALEETSVKLNPTDSILIAMYGATIGKIGILSFPATTNQACCACLDYKIDKMYIFYFLLSNRINFVSMGGGGAQPNISKEKIVNTTFPLPPLAEQKRIVSKIEELFHQLDMIEESL